MTKDELERPIEELQADVEPAAGTPSVSVSWGAAAPDERPTGMTFDSATGELRYDLWDAQEECLAALEGGEHDIVAFLGGYGSGKSSLGARWLLASAFAHPGSRFLAMGQSFKEAKETTFRTLFDQLPGGGAPAFDPGESPVVAAYGKGARMLVLTNGSVIVLGSADHRARYAGAEFGAIWLDEPSHYDTDLHDLLEMLTGRLRGVDGPGIQCWTLTGNGYNDAWEILEQRQDSTGAPLGIDIQVCRANSLENPYFDADARDRYRRQYAGTDRAAQTLYGGFAAAQGLIYSAFQRDRHVISHTEACERVDGGWRIYRDTRRVPRGLPPRVKPTRAFN